MMAVTKTALKESAAVAEMRASVGGEVAACLSDLTALRFLRARSLNVRKAVKMYTEYLAWRRREQIDAILDEPPHAPEHELVMSECFSPRMLRSLDTKGRPILFLSIGKVDMPALKRHGVTLEMVMRRYVRELERVQGAVEAAPHPERGQLALTDIGGCTPRTFLANLKMLIEVAHVGSAYVAHYCRDHIAHYSLPSCHVCCACVQVLPGADGLHVLRPWAARRRVGCARHQALPRCGDGGQD